MTQLLDFSLDVKCLQEYFAAKSLVASRSFEVDEYQPSASTIDFNSSLRLCQGLISRSDGCQSGWRTKKPRSRACIIKVLVCLLSIVDDTELMSKIIIRELEQTLKELLLDQNA